MTLFLEWAVPCRHAGLAPRPRHDPISITRVVSSHRCVRPIVSGWHEAQFNSYKKYMGVASVRCSGGGEIRVRHNGRGEIWLRCGRGGEIWVWHDRGGEIRVWRGRGGEIQVTRRNSRRGADGGRVAQWRRGGGEEEAVGTTRGERRE
jgi:hypothetical protein